MNQIKHPIQAMGATYKFADNAEFFIDEEFGIPYRITKHLEEELRGIRLHPWHRLRVHVSAKEFLGSNAHEKEIVTFRFEGYAYDSRKQNEIGKVAYLFTESAMMLARLSGMDFKNWIAYHYKRWFEHEAQEWFQYHGNPYEDPHK